ncbi:protocadherin-10-like [Chiloscyllium plagiosum]|uniref:protocadherin-10-like n=1 Tax=Chiloscyllium plagiosum TaxID=36176 RepID=UPI001CB7DF62|nr:protocadherin-10-like [Chiloscyllium plagiosum]
MANTPTSETLFIFLFSACHLVSGQIRYSIPEEMEHGAFVGNIAEDLRLNIWELSARRFRLVSDYIRQYIEVNLENGNLFINKRIDREQLCGQNPTCTLAFQIALNDPMEMHPVTVEIIDENDNSPSFEKAEYSLQISELIAAGARFPLESAHDPDVGTNTISTYQVSSNAHFAVKVQSMRDGSKNAELLLEKPLDREQQQTFHLALTAIDGGVPHRSGTVQIIITVVDANDNPPIFDQDIYRAKVPENAEKGTLVIKLEAADLDEGTNAELTYSFTNHVNKRNRALFHLHPKSGEISVLGKLDFEESPGYDLDIQAVDNAPPGLSGRCKVVVDIIDINDNAPELDVTLVLSAVREDSPPGTVIAVISVTDLDSSEYGNVQCQIQGSIPFKLENPMANTYTLITSDVLDRETVPIYNITISAWDGGSPPLATSKIFTVSVTDVNDNAPTFTQSSYNVYLMENNTPGTSIFAVTALDVDLGRNGEISYSILESKGQEHLASVYVTINSKSGNICPLRSFDYEQLKHFKIQIQAQDAGSPPLSSTATVTVIILDQNDNAPVIISPLTWNDSAIVEISPQSIIPGYLVTKVQATDADSGQNARLSYQLLEATDYNLFTVGLLTGEIRATLHVNGKDMTTEKLVICVKDNGQPSLSSTATIVFSILSNITEKPLDRTDKPLPSEYLSYLNRYLIIILGSTSFLFLITIILLVIFKLKQDISVNENDNSTACCHKRRNSTDIRNRGYATNEPINYTMPCQTEGYRYTVCLSPESSKSDFLFLKPCHPTLPLNSMGSQQTGTRK